jgi:hypothetical protein
MAVGRDKRMAERRPRLVAVFGDDDPTLRSVVEVIALLEMAWHDCYGEITPAEEVIDNVLLCSGGTVTGLVSAAHLAVIDQRDLWIAADAIRRTGSAKP